MNQPKKLNAFESILRARILRGELRSDGEVYVESLQEGFLPKHGREVLRKLVREGSVRVLGGAPRVSKEGYREPRELEIVENGTV
jgi:hypothetical protein